MDLNEIVNEEGKFSHKKLFLFLLGLLVILSVLGLIASYMGFIGGWASLPAKTYSVENVKKEYEQFYTLQNSLRANKANLSNASKRKAELLKLNGENADKWSFSVKEEFRQVTQSETQFTTAYNASCSAYQAKWDNVFHSMAAPGDIPRDCAMIQ